MLKSNTSIALALLAFILFSINPVIADRLTNTRFDIEFTDQGITSLKRVNDQYDTNYIAANRALGTLITRYRLNSQADWREITSYVTSDTADPNTIRYISTVEATDPNQPPIPTKEVQIVQQFTLNKESLNWTITLSNQTHQPLIIGDLGIPMCFAERTPRNRGSIYTQKLLRHSTIAGHGSWIYWQRANAVGPYLVMTPQESTSLQYFDNTRYTFTPYIHASVACSEPLARAQAFGRQNPWRLPLSDLKLAPSGQNGDSVRYGFKFQFAPDVDGVRQVLYRENLFDTTILPGMVVPIDLPATIVLHTQNDINSIQAEHPDRTRIQYVGETQPDYHVYQVHFQRLGENLLQVKYGNDRWMSLEFFVTEPLETVIQKRSRFLVTHMQHNDPTQPWYGAYGDWDQINKVLRNPEDRDGLRPWLVDSSDDAGNARPAYIAAKNVFFPDQSEIASVERYIRYYLWNDLKDGKGGMQMTADEDYPYGIYGTFTNWWGHRASDDPGRDGRAHLWRIYDYPHIIHLYYRMYQIGRFYPDLLTYKNADEYLELAYRTAKAYWEVPKKIEDWSANSVGTMNEAFLPELIEALAREGKQTWSDTLRSYWESKVAHFVLQTPNLYGSEFSFDSTGFESTQAFARYAVNNVGIQRVDAPSVDIGLKGQTPARFSDITPAAAQAFQDFQMRLNVCDRGWLETTYYQLGSDYRGSTSYLLSYMSHLGGWAVLDHGLYFAKDPTPYLQLGYASSLSAWSLVNSGNAQSGYGYWYPDPENDGATGGGFVPEVWGRGWIGKQMARGAWYYSAEEEVGYVGALRTHCTILTHDPLIGDYVYGGTFTRQPGQISLIPRDGLRRRLHIVRPHQRVHLILEPDAFAPEQSIVVQDDLSRITFHREHGNRPTHLYVAGLPGNHSYQILQNDQPIMSITGGVAEQRIDLPANTAPQTILTIKYAP